MQILNQLRLFSGCKPKRKKTNYIKYSSGMGTGKENKKPEI